MVQPVPRLVRWLLLLSAVLALAVAQAQHDGVQLVILSGSDGAEGNKISSPYIAQCEADLGVSVEFSELSQSALQTRVATLHAARSPEADIVWTWAGVTAQWGSAGLFLDITDMVSAEEWDTFVPGALNAVTYEGRRYGIPRFFSIRHFYYNTAMFEEAGLDPSRPPRDWDEFVEAALATTDPSIGRYAVLHDYGSNNSLQINFMEHLVLTGGRFFDADGNLTINDGAAVDALSRIVELNELGVVDPASFGIGEGPAKRARWIQGNNSMQWGWAADWAQSNDPAISNIVGDVAVGLIPGIVEESGAVTGSEGFSITTHSRNPEAALDLLLCMMSAENQKDMSLRTGWYPVRRAAFEDPEVQAASPLAAAAAAQSQHPTYRFAAPFQSEFTDILGPHLLAAIQGQVTPQEALDAAAAELEAMIARY